MEKAVCADEKGSYARAQAWIESGVLRRADYRVVARMMKAKGRVLQEAFGTSLDFGTGGVRALMGVGTARINRYTVGLLTQGLCRFLHQKRKDSSIKVCIGWDSRYQSEILAKAASAVILGHGGGVYLFDSFCPTPLLSYATRYLGCDAGIMITASHNPKQYNGYKVYNEEGAQFVSPADKELIHQVAQVGGLSDLRMERDISQAVRIGREVEEAYYDTIMRWIDKYGLWPLSGVDAKALSSFRVVYTPLHGVGGRIIGSYLERMGFSSVWSVSSQSASSDFATIETPNPEEEANLSMAKRLAQKKDAHLVMGTDADADRLGIMVRDEKNHFRAINGNQLGAMLFDFILGHLKERNILPPNAWVAKTIVSSSLIESVSSYYGVPCENTLTGFKYIAALIAKHASLRTFLCGAEESYGYLIGDFVRDKDAVMASLMTALMGVSLQQKEFSLWRYLISLYRRHGLYEERLFTCLLEDNLDSRARIRAFMRTLRKDSPRRIGSHELKKSKDYLHETNMMISDVMQYYTTQGGKITVRPSGTESKIKIYVGLHAAWREAASYDAQREKLGKEAEQINADLMRMLK